MISNITVKVNKFDRYDNDYGLFYLFKSQTPEQIEKNETLQIGCGGLSCRDSVALLWNPKQYPGYELIDLTRLGMRSSLLNIENLNKFFEEIENRLSKAVEGHIVSKYPLRFHKVEGDDKMVVVSVTKFWRENTVTRSLFTLLFRCAIYYYKRNGRNTVDSALEGYDYSHNTRNAINLFLSGYTQSSFGEFNTANNEGWNTKFGGLSEEQVKNFLVKP